MNPLPTAADRTGEAAARPAAIADYIALAKPRVVLMILVTTFAGFAMAAAGAAGIDYLLLGRALLGMALVSGGTLALNQYLERDIDALMHRTRRRPLPSGRMQPIEALIFGGTLTSAGLMVLSLAVNPLCGLVTGLTTASYLLLYTPMKTRSALCTIVGAFPGALPPVSGWVAAGGAIDAGALALFGILFFWQIPHSLAIARIYREDYTNAGIRLLATVDRDGGSTGRQSVLNSMMLLLASILPAIVGLAGWGYLIVALAMGLIMVHRSARFAGSESPRRARRLLAASYVYVPAVMLAMAADRMFL